MSLLARRRAMMELLRKGDPISTLAAGSKVYVMESGVLTEFVYLGINKSGNAVLMRSFPYNNQLPFNTTIQTPEYSASNVDGWLINTAKPKFTALSRYFRSSSITYSTYNSSHVESITTISRDIYIPSFYEMTGSGNEGGDNYLPALKTYKNTTNNNTARAVNNTAYWLRSEFSSSSYPNRVNNVEMSGNCVKTSSFSQSNATGPRVRPILSISAETPMRLANDIIVVGG
jgi:hypothetical protein